MIEVLASRRQFPCKIRFCPQRSDHPLNNVDASSHFHCSWGAVPHSNRIAHGSFGASTMPAHDLTSKGSCKTAHPALRVVAIWEDLCVATMCRHADRRAASVRCAEAVQWFPSDVRDSRDAEPLAAASAAESHPAWGRSQGALLLPLQDCSGVSVGLQELRPCIATINCDYSH
jgi:hypothetical protein